MPLISAKQRSAGDATALDEQVAAVFGDSHNRLDIAVAVKVKGAVVASTG